MALNTENICMECFSELGQAGKVCVACGYDNNVAANAGAGNVLPPFSTIGGRYLLGRVLGIGGFGITYVACDIRTQTRVAIKEFFPGSIASRDAATGQVYPTKREKEYTSGLQRFSDEAKVLKQLRTCPSIVYVLDFFESNGTAYMVMEYVKGRNLKLVMRDSGGRIPYKDALKYCIQVALALSLAHTNHILHRDVSPENIILKEDGSIKLIDFGAARPLYRQLGEDALVVLKPGFAPPEQYSEKGQQGAWTDVYALSCTLYRLITGLRLPEASERQKGVPVELLHTVCNDVPPSVSLAVKKGMELDITERFQSIDKFIEALMEHEGEDTTHITETDEGIVGLPEEETDPSPEPYFIKESITKIKDWVVKKTNPVAIVLSGEHAGEQVHLENGKEVTIGRLNQCDLTTENDIHISRTHCILTYFKEHRVVVFRDESSAGTYHENGIFTQRGDVLHLTETSTFQLATSPCIVKVVIR